MEGAAATDMSVDEQQQQQQANGDDGMASNMSIEQAIDDEIMMVGQQEEDDDADVDDPMDAQSSSPPQQETFELDCYPYTFTPLLLFAQAGYFDKGHSNYNAVSQFFSSVIPINMLDNVLYERTNMLYEQLYDHVLQNEMLVTCCIDAHFTAFKVVDKKKPCVIYYDPARSSLLRVTGGQAVQSFCLFLLLKCNYGDSQHIQDNKDYYTSSLPYANNLRRTIHQLWKNINKLESPKQLYQVNLKPTPLNLNRYLLINDARLPRVMSTQLTSNTCYFQTYL